MNGLMLSNVLVHWAQVPFLTVKMYLAKLSPARGCAVAVPRLILAARASLTISAGPALVVI
jgi:hypothetical protein